MVLLVLSGCSRPGEFVGDQTWLDYDGEYKDAVVACIGELPNYVEGRRGDFSSAAVVTDVAVDFHRLDDVKSEYEISGKLTLEYSSEAHYRWECDVSQRWYQVKVDDIRSEED